MKRVLLSILLVALTAGLASADSAVYSGAKNSELVDPNNTPISSSTDEDGTTHLSIAAIQEKHISAGNSSTANLLSGATFTGVAASTIGVSGIQVTLKADTNCRVIVEQSTDGVNWDIDDQFQYYYSINNFSTTVQAVANYFRVRVINQGVVATTVFRLQSSICPIVEAVPRSLDDEGNFKVVVNEITDEYGFNSENTPNGELRAITPVLLVGSSFEGSTVDPNFWTASVSSGATISQVNDTIVVSSNGTGTTATGGAAKFASVRRARYIPGASMLARFQLSLNNTGVAGNTRRWCAAWGATLPTITDGACFALNGTTLAVETLKSGATTTVPSGSFNGVLGATYNVDTNFHSWEIYYTNTQVFFTVDGEVLHTYSRGPTTWTDTTQLHIYVDSINSGVSTTNSITCASAGIRRLGALHSQSFYKYQAGTTAGVTYKYGVGNLHEVIISGVVNNAVVTLYDNTSATGATIWSSGAMSNQTVPLALDFKGLPFFTGLTLAITGANCNALIIYE